MTNVTHISADGECTLFKLMRDGARFSSRGVLAKHSTKPIWLEGVGLLLDGAWLSNCEEFKTNLKER